MFQMLTCFNLKPGISLDEFKSALDAFAAHLKERGLAEGCGAIQRRCSDTMLDTDRERDHSFFVLMDFRDRAQSDAARDYLRSGQEPGLSRHRAVNSKAQDPIFICWQDC